MSFSVFKEGNIPKTVAMFGFLEFEGNKMEKKCIRKKLKFIQIFSLLVAHVAVDFSSQKHHSVDGF